MAKLGVSAQGILCPFIRKGDNIVDIVVDSVLKSTFKGMEMVTEWLPVYDIKDKSIICITESVVARSFGQYITVDEIAEDIKAKFGSEAVIYLIDPIYSRNRFSVILKGIARAARKLYITMPTYDEVGNYNRVNPFTGVNIQDFYKDLCKSENCECEILYDGNSSFCYSAHMYDNIIYCGLHDFAKWRARFGSEKYYTLKDICSDKSPDWGVLGTNKADEETLKLFPSKELCDKVCIEVKNRIYQHTGKDVIVCVYGDGCFKDPVGGIWEFADPITMPGYTDADLIESAPEELKLKAIIDSGLSDENVNQALENAPRGVNKMNSMGTTPRIRRDSIASLADLVSGSGDRQTPVVLIQNYF